MIWDVDSYILMESGWVKLPTDEERPPFQSDPKYRAEAKERYHQALAKQRERYLKRIARGSQSRP